jgi:hypothetical protein
MSLLQQINDDILAALYWAASLYYHMMLHWLLWSIRLPSVFASLSCLLWVSILILTIRTPIMLPGMIYRVITTNMALRARGKLELKHSLDTYGGLSRIQAKVRI